MNRSKTKLIFLSWATSCFGSFAVLCLYQAVDTFSSGKLGELSILQAGNTSETKLGQDAHCTGQYLSPVHFKDNLIQPHVNSGKKKKKGKFGTCMCV